MAQAHAGIRLLESGMEWRKMFLTGTPIQSIASTADENAQVVSRAIWLAKIPYDIKQIILENPDVFSRRTLINGFASKRAQCEKNSFQLLRSEVQRMAKEGAGSKPKFPKKIPTKEKKKIEKKTAPLIEDKTPSNISVTTNILEAMTAEKQIKDALGFHCRVAFNEAGESQVTFNLKSIKDLNTFIEMVTPNTGLF